MEIYLGMRDRALHIASNKPKLLAQLDPAAPLAALMDMNIPNGRFGTIVAFADGTVSVYNSRGGGVLGGGQGYEAVRKAGQDMVAIAHESQPLMHVTQDFSLPQTGQVSFYLVMNSGVFTASVSEAACRSQKDPLTKLYFAAQRTITQYRLVAP